MQRVSLQYIIDPMDEGVKVIYKIGKELTAEELNVINFWRMKEFNSKSLINPVEGDDNWEKVYFLLYGQHGQVLAFCRIHEVNLKFLDKNYSILGLATLISTVPGKGYGKRLAQEQMQYIRKSGKTGIGFCNQKLTEYYRKIGFGIIENGIQRFLYENDEGELIPDNWGGGDVIYVEGEDGLINEILSHPEEKVISYRQHW